VMMVVIFGFGYIYGRLYRKLVTWRKSGALLGFACTSSVLAQAALLEVSLAKLVGGLISSVLITMLFISLVAPRLRAWLGNDLPSDAE